MNADRLPVNAALEGLRNALVPLSSLPETMSMLGDASSIDEVARIKDELWGRSNNSKATSTSRSRTP